MTVTTALDHRPAQIRQVPVQPLLAQHGDERGEQGDQKTRVHEPGGDDGRILRALPSGWNDGDPVGGGGLIEGEENCAEEVRRLLAGIGLEARTDVYGKRGADGRRQTRL